MLKFYFTTNYFDTWYSWLISKESYKVGKVQIGSNALVLKCPGQVSGLGLYEDEVGWVVLIDTKSERKRRVKCRVYMIRRNYDESYCSLKGYCELTFTFLKTRTRDYVKEFLDKVKGITRENI